MPATVVLDGAPGRDDRQPLRGPVHPPEPRPWSSTRPPPDPTAGAQLCFRPTLRALTSGAVKDLRPLPRAQFPPRAPCRALLDPAAYLDAPKPADHAERKISCRGQGVDRPRPCRDDLHVLADAAAVPGAAMTAATLMTAAAFRMAGARAPRNDAEVNDAVAGLLRRPRPVGMCGDAPVRPGSVADFT
jgi:hypothetical protein